METEDHREREKKKRIKIGSMTTGESVNILRQATKVEKEG